MFNKKIKQLRWNNRFLISKNYTGFTEKETILLYDELVNILGDNDVTLYKK
jgi:hypothetical protein